MVNNADREILYTNGIILVNSAGTLYVANCGSRGVGRFVSDSAVVYMGGSNNMETTELTWINLSSMDFGS